MKCTQCLQFSVRINFFLFGHQNMGWYDVNSTGILSTRLAVDASEVKGVGMGERGGGGGQQNDTMNT